MRVAFDISPRSVSICMFGIRGQHNVWVREKWWGGREEEHLGQGCKSGASVVPQVPNSTLLSTSILWFVHVVASSSTDMLQCLAKATL